MSDSGMDMQDTEMEERLRRLADSSRTPSLPAETAALPWTVQSEKQRFSLLRNLPSMGGVPGRAGRAAFAGMRLAATLAMAFGLLFVVSHTRTSGSGASIVPPQVTPRPTPAVGVVSGPEVVVLPTSGVVDSVMADYVAGGVHRAEADGAAAVIIQLDTLGGSEAAMMRIVGSLHAKVPTIVWVGPSGAKAASAGTFITLAANLAYMAPSTNIGAASPVAAGGGDIASTYGSTEAAKVLNDAVATIRGIAQERHPEAVDWAATTVAEAKSYSADEALAKHGINGIATSLDDVLIQADLQTVTVDGKQVVVHTKGATTVTVNEDLIQSFLHGLDDPDIAFILLVIGVLCVVVEFFHPTLLMGLLGAFSLALSFYGSGSLPLNVLGVVLVVLGLGMVALEPGVPSHGLLTVVGLISFIVGAVAFYGSPGPYLPAATVAWPIIAVTAAAAAAYGLIFLRTLLQMRHQAVPVGSGLVGTVQVVGMTGEVQADLAPIGTVYVAGETWSARLAGGGAALRGAKIKVVGQEGLMLVVELVG
jgi:membrane-bound serine protease (ClpP class)